MLELLEDQTVVPVDGLLRSVGGGLQAVFVGEEELDLSFEILI